MLSQIPITAYAVSLSYLVTTNEDRVELVFWETDYLSDSEENILFASELIPTIFYNTYVNYTFCS
jgi:hypothetical protein